MKLDDSQKISGPDWMDREFFSVTAALPAGATMDQVPEMPQALLAERCRLAVQWEGKEQMGYAVSVGRDGPEMKKTASDASSKPDFASTGGRTFMVGGQTAYGWIAEYRVNGHALIEGKGITVSDLLTKSFFGREVDGPVVDMTGLDGLYDLFLPVPGLWLSRAMDKKSGDVAAASDPAGVDLDKSFEKLGLQLERRKVTIKHLVVDHVERIPTGN